MTLQIDNAGLETRIECAGPAYCPGQVCCGRRKFFQANGQNMAVYDQLTCESQCAYPDIIVCDAQTQCPDLPGENGNPPVKSVCQQSQLLPGGYTVRLSLRSLRDERAITRTPSSSPPGRNGGPNRSGHVTCVTFAVRAKSWWT